MHDNKTLFLNYFLITLAMTFWAVSFVQVEILLRFLNPPTIVFGRLLFAAIFLNIYFFSKKRKDKINKKNLKIIALMALCEPTLYFMGESFALQYISSSVASIIISMIPLFVPFFSYLFFKDKVSLKQIIGTIISFFGVIFIIVNKDLTFQYSIKGLLLLLLAVFSAIGYAQLSRLIDKDIKPINIVRYQNIFASIYFLPVFLFANTTNNWDITFNYKILINIFLLAFFPSTLSFIIYNHCFRILGVNTTNLFSNLIPVITTVFSYLVLNEIITIQKFIGIIIVLFGLFLAQYKPKRKRRKYIPLS